MKKCLLALPIVALAAWRVVGVRDEEVRQDAAWAR